MTSLSRVSGPLDAPAHQAEAAFAGTDAMMPIASVIIVNYNGRHHLEKCIPSLRREGGLDYEIILVDNASTDGSAAYVERAFPEVRVVRSETNLGFSRPAAATGYLAA